MGRYKARRRCPPLPVAPGESLAPPNTRSRDARGTVPRTQRLKSVGARLRSLPKPRLTMWNRSIRARETMALPRGCGPLMSEHNARRYCAMTRLCWRGSAARTWAGPWCHLYKPKMRYRRDSERRGWCATPVAAPADPQYRARQRAVSILAHRGQQWLP